MVSYTTPVLVLRVPKEIKDADMFVTFRQDAVCMTLKIDPDDIYYEDGKTVLKVYMTQEQTGRLRPEASTKVQVNWIYSDGTRNATKVKDIDISENLLTREIEHAD